MSYMKVTEFYCVSSLECCVQQQSGVKNTYTEEGNAAAKDSTNTDIEEGNAAAKDSTYTDTEEGNAAAKDSTNTDIKEGNAAAKDSTYTDGPRVWRVFLNLQKH